MKVWVALKEEPLIQPFIINLEEVIIVDNRLVQEHYENLNNLTSLLSNSINSYRLLVSSAAELNTISYAKKGAVKDAIERVEAVGEIIDDLIKVVKKCESSYCKYCVLKNDIGSGKNKKEDIDTEVEMELNYHNNK